MRIARYRVIPRVRRAACVDIPHGRIAVLEHKDTVGKIIRSIV